MKSTIKVVGAMFSNEKDIDKLNTDLACQNFHFELSKSFGIQGTVFQKTYMVNTYLFSKIWYLSQVFKMDVKVINKLLSKAMQFIYAGENERPVRAVNFRETKEGGLGLFNPVIKSKAFLIKSMRAEFGQSGCDRSKINQLNGWGK